MRQPIALLLAVAALCGAGCSHRRPHRSAGDEVPYPPIDDSALDRSVPACQDFYQFACGGWLAETALPPDRLRWERGAGEVEERDARLLQRILEDAAAGKVSPQDRHGRKAGDFYAACLDEADVEASGRAELQAAWAPLEAVADRDGLADELARLEAMGVAAPFALRAGVDPSDAGRGVLVLAPAERAPGLVAGAPEPAGEGQGAAADPAVARLARLLELSGEAVAQAAEDARGAVRLERALAQARGEPRPARLDRAALVRLAPGFPWARLLRGVGAERAEAVVLADPAHAAGAAELFARAPLAEWRAYLKWRLLAALAAERALPAALVDGWRPLGEEGGAAPRPRWRHCVGATARALGGAVGNTFARKHLGPGGRERGGRLASAMVRGMGQALEAAPWVDAATQALAAARLAEVDLQVGYPDATPDYGGLRVGRDSYLRNVLSAGRFAVAREVARAQRPVDRAEWLVSPFAAAPVFLSDRGVLVVPAGALQPPLANPQAPPAVTLGALGTAVGHALAGAVQPDPGPAGGSPQAWTPAAAQRHREGAACLARQLGAYEPLPGTRIDGDAAAADALAELAGLRAAYEALRAERQAPSAPERRLAGFTPEQQFFVAYAQARCAVAADGEVRRESALGPAAPARFRVDAPLSNLAEFALAFRCGPGTPMARSQAERCEVW